MTTEFHQDDAAAAARAACIEALTPVWGTLAEVRHAMGECFHENLALTESIRLSYITAVVDVRRRLNRGDITEPQFEALVASLAEEVANLYRH